MQSQVAIGVNASGYFIVVANSFMQHPVGAEYNSETGRAQLTSIGDLLSNNTAFVLQGGLVTGLMAILLYDAMRVLESRLVPAART